MVDKLVKVWRKDGKETWVLVHIEVQGQVDYEFANRMYSYHYRLYDRYARQIVSVAILADDRKSWRPSSFGYELWGCKISLEFPVVKLLDYERQWSQLEQNPNPFAVIIMAHLKAIATYGEPEDRFRAKLGLTKLLYKRGYSRKQILELYRFIDWVIQLPEDLDNKLVEAINEFEEERKMQYISYAERRGMQQGMQQGLLQGLLKGIELGLELKFGVDGMHELPKIRKIDNIDVLNAIYDEMKKAETLDELRQFIKNRGIPS